MINWQRYWSRAAELYEEQQDGECNLVRQLRGVHTALIRNDQPTRPVLTEDGNVEEWPWERHPEQHQQVLFSWLCKHREVNFVIELGAGYGRNVLALADTFPDVQFAALEPEPAGRRLCRLIADDHGLDNVIVDGCDLNDLQLPIGDPARTLLFTVHAIEQVRELPEDAIPHMAERARLGIFFEPLGTKYCQRVDGYNCNLLRRLAEARGTIRVTDTRRDAWGGRPDNPTSIVWWESQSANVFAGQ